MTSLIRGSMYGDPRVQASRELPHGLTGETIDRIADRFESFIPGISSEHGSASKQFFSGLLPEGAELSPRTHRQAQFNMPGGGALSNFIGGGAGGGGGTMVTPQQPYMPEFASPDRQCCVEGTLITLSDGTTKPIEDIKVGDKVLDKNGHIQTVIKHWCSGTPDELIEIKLWGAKEVIVTKNHKLPVWAWVHKCLCGCGQFIKKPGKCFLPRHDIAGYNLKYVDGAKIKPRHNKLVGDRSTRFLPEGYEPIQKLNAENVRIGDCLLIPRQFDEIKSNISADQARLLGYYVAEGCKNTAGHTNRLVGSIWYFGVKEQDTWVADAVKILQKLKVDVKVKVDQRHGTGCAVITTGKQAKILAKWLIENAGEYAGSKRFSQDVMRWPLKLKEELIRGAFRGDGSKFINNMHRYDCKNFKVSYTTTSPNLAGQIQLILVQLGFYAAINRHRAWNAKPHHLDTYKLHLMNDHAYDLARLVWGKIRDNRHNHVRQRYKVDQNFIRLPIKSVQTIKNDAPVYNITVSGDHSYLINNVGSFNSYPIHRILANRYWRLFYKLDPTIGTCIDMMSTMPWSDCQLTGEGVTGEIKEAYEEMWQECELLKILEYMVKEFLVIGEVCNHCFFDDSKGIWTYIALHNPDQLEVIDAPFIKMAPVVEFIPDDRLRAVLTSNNHLLRRIKEQMPAELIARLIARQNIPLSPINATFIPRKLHPYDTRGTSIISRMWRILLYEDSIYNASIQTARRQSSPIKLMKLGNPQTGWIPSPEHEQRLLRLLAQAELDPASWIVYHYGIQAELIGVQERVMNISQHNEVIERIKLVALGISKAFLTGEVTYSCLREDEPVLLHDYSVKPIQSIEVGDRVLDKNGDIQIVEAAWNEGIPDELMEIKLWGGKKIVVTKNHQWPVWAWPRTCSCGCGQELTKPGMCFIRDHHTKTGNRHNTIELKYVDGETAPGGKPRRIPVNYQPLQKLRSDELRIGDYLMIPRKFKVMSPSVSLDQARLLGYYVSEGCADRNKKLLGVKWTLNIKERETWGKDIVDICKSLGIHARIDKCTTKNAIGVKAINAQARQLFGWLYKHANEYSRSKRLSNEVMHWPIEYKIELLKGMFHGDGSQYLHNIKNRYGKKYKEFKCAYTTISKELAYQVQNIIAQIGFYACVDVLKERVGKDGSKRSKTYFVGVYGNHARALTKLLWNYTVAFEPKNKIRDRYRIDDDYVYVPIRFITKIKNDKPVYNLSISNSHSYLANGIATYNSAYTGLSVFLQRMKAMRNFFVNSWVIPKFFTPIAKMNGWVKSDKKELNHRYRIKRSQREIEQQNRYIVPHIEWEKQLDQTINSDLVNAMTSLEGLGIKFSKTTKYAAVNKKFEEEVRKIKEEQKFEMELAPYIAPSQVAGGPGAPGGAPPMPTSSGPPAPMGGEPEAGAGALPPGAMGPGAEASSDKAGAGGGTGPSGKKDPAVRDMDSSIWDRKGHAGNWTASEIHELDQLIREGHTDSPLWGDLDGPAFRKAVNSQDAWQVLEVIEDHLTDHGYPADDIRQLRRILDEEGVLKDISTGDVETLKSVERKMDDSGALKDDDAMERLSSQIDGEKTGAVALGDPELLYVGHGNQDIGSWSGDISDKIPNR